MAGDLNVVWIHGSSNCAATMDPAIQVHRFNANTFILRQSKCSEPGTATSPGPSFEAPFMYLLLGAARAVLIDTGASSSPARFPLASTVGKLLHDNTVAQGKPILPLLIVHSHSHGDHCAGDAQFHGAPDMTLVSPGLDNVKSFFQLPHWPEGSATLDLGGRILDVIPSPGHEESHIVLYDRNDRLLLTGDTLYPGLLVVNDWPEYVKSVARLSSFVQAHPVSFILGAHIEMTSQPGKWFGLGTLFQPGEHVLQLATDHLTELHGALQSMGPHPRTERHADFIIHPAGQPLPAPDP